jgi:hypothetical protein
MRIATHMKDYLFRKLTLCAFIFLAISGLNAQSPINIAGTWQGTLGTSHRIVLKISNSASGSLQAIFYNIDSDTASEGKSATTLSLHGSDFNFTITPIDAIYQGRLSSDGASITGTFTHGGQSSPLNLVHATPDTAWAIPQPDIYMPPNADPAFEVATIKLSNPNRTNDGFHTVGRHVSMTYETLANLISLTYGLHSQQIIGEPAWFSTDRYDVDGIADVDGQPDFPQMQSMYKKLLADRFNLKVHYEKKVLAVYTVTVAKSGPKLSKSQGDPQWSARSAGWSARNDVYKRINVRLCPHASVFLGPSRSG